MDLQARIAELEAEVDRLKRCSSVSPPGAFDTGKPYKELLCIYNISELIEDPDLSIEKILQGAVERLPGAFVYPEITCVRLFHEEREYRTPNFRETPWRREWNILVRGEKAGKIEVCRLEERPGGDDGPFSAEERRLLEVIAGKLGRTIERIRTKKELEASEARFRDLYENAPVAYFSLEAQGRIIRCNRKAGDLLGCPAGTLPGKSIVDLCGETPEGRERALLVLEKHEKGFPVADEVLEMRRSDGSPLWVALTVVLHGERKNGPRERIAMAIDVTGLKQMEVALRESESRYRAIIENAGEGICVLLDGNIRYMNPYAQRVSGYPYTFLLNRRIFDFVHPEDRETAEENYRRRLAGESVPPNYEIRFRTKDGNYIWVSINGMRIQWEGHPASLIFMSDVTDRRRAEEALRENEKLFREITANLPGVVYQFYIRNEDDWGLYHVSEASRDILGMDNDCERFFQRFLDSVVPEDRERFLSSIREAWRLHSPWNFEGRFLRGDGREIHVRGTSRPEARKGETIWNGFLLDITERKMAEEALRESRQRLADIIEFLPEGTLVINGEGKVIAWNRTMEEMTGVQAADMLGKGNYEYALPFYGKRRPMLIDLVLRPREDIERTYEGIERDGTTLKGEIRMPSLRGKEAYLVGTAAALRDSKGNVVGAIETLRDVTDRRHAEERYMSLAMNSPIGVYIAQGGRFVFINPYISRFTGYRLDDLLGKNVLDFILPEDRENVRENARKMLREGGGSPYEFRAIDKKGNVLWVMEIVTSIHYQGKRAILGNLMDVTEQKHIQKERERLKEQLLQAQKLEAVGTLAGGIAHDFNNILMGILGHGSLMSLGMEKGHPFHERLKEIEDLVQSGTRLTRQLLGFARGGRYEVKPTDLNDLMVRTSALFGRTRREITIHRKCAEGLPAVDVDRGQVEQVLMNLLVNAWHAMPGGGDLFLETANVVLGEKDVEPLGLAPGSYVKVSITDTGTGMDEKTRARIFEPFFTTREMGRGTGLGLSIVYGIMQGHRGMVTVESEKGRGTRFDLFFPASAQEARKEEDLSRKLLRGTETLLLVDDEEIVADVTRQMLEFLGYRVLTARSGQDALDVFRGQGGKIDMVILDMIMPGMSGGETFDRIREIAPRIPVILASGYSLNGQARSLLGRGFMAFIQKPFPLPLLSQKIREILDAQRQDVPGNPPLSS
jgi:PAS domain S-box-containing protein